MKIAKIVINVLNVETKHIIVKNVNNVLWHHIVINVLIVLIVLIV